MSAVDLESGCWQAEARATLLRGRGLSVGDVGEPGLLAVEVVGERYDRLVSTAHEFIIEGDYQRRQKPTKGTKDTNTGVSVDRQNGDHHAH